MRFFTYGMVLSTGTYFAYVGLWSEYLTSKKRRELSMMSLTLMSFGALATGAFFSTHLFAKGCTPSKFVNLSNMMKIFMGVGLLYSISVELMERNLFYWGLGTFTSVA